MESKNTVRKSKKKLPSVKEVLKQKKKEHEEKDLKRQ